MRQIELFNKRVPTSGSTSGNFTAAALPQQPAFRASLIAKARRMVSENVFLSGDSVGQRLLSTSLLENLQKYRFWSKAKSVESIQHFRIQSEWAVKSWPNTPGSRTSDSELLSKTGERQKERLFKFSGIPVHEQWTVFTIRVLWEYSNTFRMHYNGAGWCALSDQFRWSSSLCDSTIMWSTLNHIGKN